MLDEIMVDNFAGGGGGNAKRPTESPNALG
jgi:hypothetical protein